MNNGLLGGLNLGNIGALGIGIPFVVVWLRLMVSFLFGVA